MKYWTKDAHILLTENASFYILKINNLGWSVGEVDLFTSFESYHWSYRGT